MQVDDEYDRALGHATRELAELESMVYILVSRLHGTPPSIARAEFARLTLKQLLACIPDVLAAREDIDAQTRQKLEELLAIAAELADTRNEMLHSGHAYSKHGPVLARKDGGPPRSLALKESLTPSAFDGIAERARAVHLDLFMWVIDELMAGRQ